MQLSPNMIFDGNVISDINYDNFALSVSNLYAIRPFIWLVDHGMYLQAASIFFAAFFSFWFHMVQYDETVKLFFTINGVHLL